MSRKPHTLGKFIRAMLLMALVGFHFPSLATTADMRSTADAIAPSSPVTLGDQLENLGRIYQN